MEPVDEIFAEYVISHHSGQSDPRPFISRVDGRDREDLVLLIDAYLIRAPGRNWDPEAFKGSAAERMIEPLTKAVCGEAGTWPVLLPNLRHRARILREELVARLAAGLGVSDSTELVADYYHGMEQGNLESAGVSDRVLEVLGEILGATVDSLKRAGETLGGGESAGDHAVFARANLPLRSSDEDRIAQSGQWSPPVPEPGEPGSATDQEVDRLFTGGNA